LQQIYAELQKILKGRRYSSYCRIDIWYRNDS
jgi:hypothetical protein